LDEFKAIAKIPADTAKELASCVVSVSNPSLTNEQCCVKSIAQSVKRSLQNESQQLGEYLPQLEQSIALLIRQCTS